MSPTTSDGPDESHRAPPGVHPETVEALGKLSEALETVERARGHLYSFHQLSGHADAQLSEAADLLRSAGHQDLADRLRSEVVGRNVIDGRWTFEIVEDYDESYWAAVRTVEQSARDQLVRGRRHLYEAGMKVDEQRAADRTDGSEP